MSAVVQGSRSTPTASPAGFTGRNRLLTAVLVDTLGSGAFLPLSFLYLSETTHIPLGRLGLTITLAGLIGLPAMPLTGHVVDRVGAKPVMVAQTIVSAAGFSLYFHVSGLPVLIAGVAVVTLSDRMYWATWPVFISEQVGTQELDRWYSLINAARSASLAAGGALGAALLAAGGTSGLRVTLALNIASSLVAGALFVSVRGTAGPAATPRRHAVHPAGGRSGWRTLSRDGRYLVLTLSNTLLTYAWLIPSLILPLYVVRYTVLAAWVAAVALTVKLALAAVLQPIVARGLTGLRRTTTAFVGASAFLVAVILLALASSVSTTAAASALILAGVVFLAVGETAAGPAETSLAVAAAPALWRGRYVSVFQLSWSVSAITGPALVGFLLGVSATAVWDVFGALVVAAGVVLLPLGRRLPAAINSKTPATVPGPAPADAS
ncbi:MFS transporter [Actinocrinis puniceicyclus]|uniref:MFS transporter n=1 Tax=Actinocrinis puniceicyclus TaxID=977794 RepID=A0A8J8BEU8_9ACTN|nr:MFS transporter [Actinocrinis puniceicyclus]MBS2966758.1 MFS transporter [Actinocrinis puniceicyclus]